MDLKNRIVLITGSSRGIGSEAAKKFAEEGSQVIITYRGSKQKAQEVFEECCSHVDADLKYLDVTDDESIKKLYDYIMQEYGRIDILVNNAGVICYSDLVKQDKEDIEKQIEVNVTGLIKITRQFLPRMYEQEEGIIVNIGSDSGYKGMKELSTYCSTKFAVRGFTKALARELPPGIDVYCVNPGMTATDMTDGIGIPAEKVAEYIIKTVDGSLDKKSGDDVDVFRHEPWQGD